jgi:hypothetical protein
MLTSKGASISKDGLPNLITGDGKALFREGNKYRIKVILTALSLGKMIPGDGTVDVIPITKPWNGSIPGHLMKWVFDRKFPDLKAVVYDFPHWSTKAGPKGQAMATRMRDLRSLPNSLKARIIELGGKPMKNYLTRMWDMIHDSPLSIGSDEVRGWSKSSIRRIHVIKDKEMKSRVIAILDYWSQSVLKPYHDKLMSMIQSQPGDFTIQKSPKRWLAGGRGTYHSFDLTQRTDRFPVAFQQLVFGKIFGFDKAEAWTHVMTAHRFDLPNGGTAKYMAGQPMGRYTSWAIFTMSHHLILQYIKDKIDPNVVYAILGDDLVIRGKDGAEAYRGIMLQLGVEISESKTHISENSYEFMKRWFLNQVEVTPFPLWQRVERGRDKVKLALLLDNLVEKDWHHGHNGRVGLIKELLVAQGAMGGLSAYIARQVTGFWNWMQWARTSDPALREYISPVVEANAQSMCFHIVRWARSLKMGIARRAAVQLQGVLEKVGVMTNDFELRELADQAGDTPNVLELQPGQAALAKILSKAFTNALDYNPGSDNLDKIARGSSWSDLMEVARASRLKEIPITKLPDTNTYLSERKAVSITRSLLTVYGDRMKFSAQYFATRSALAQS